MATADSVKAKMQELIDLGNQTTGNTDTDLTAVVNALIAGFGSGGSGNSMPTVTLTSGATNATEVYNIFASIKTNEVCVFIYNGESKNTGANNHCQIALVSYDSIALYRYRNGVFNFVYGAPSVGTLNAYDVIVRVGDEYLYWGVDA